MKNSVKALIAVAVLVACALGYYFLYFVKTPLYSLKLVGEAIKNKDIIQLEQHVDFHSVIDKGYDKIIVYLMKQQKEFDSDNPYILGFAQIMKPAVVEKYTSELKTMIQKEFDEETIEQKDKGKSDEKKETKADKKKATVKDFKEEIKHDSDAIVSFVAISKYDDELKIRCRMEKMSSGEWKVIEIVNIDDVLVNLARIGERDKFN